LSIVSAPAGRTSVVHTYVVRKWIHPIEECLVVEHQARIHYMQPSLPGIGALRDLAHAGTLADVARSATPRVVKRLRTSAYELAWPVVFARLTRRMELRRGHVVCTMSFRHLADECLDRFHDDVEAVVDDLLAHARTPIHNIEGWITSRLTTATVDGHRRQRGSRGALQRPRVPAWLAVELRHEPWPMALALEILTWVGTPTTAGTDLWPLDAWALKRSAVTADWQSSDPGTVAVEVERVLAAMRRRPSWFDTFIETPLGRKQVPVAPPSLAAEGTVPLPLTRRDEFDDARLRALAAAAVDAIASRLSAGAEPATAVRQVISTVFRLGTGREDLDRLPNQRVTDDDRLSAVLGDPAAIDHVVATVLEIIASERGLVIAG
jgi:hypothetical protein